MALRYNKLWKATCPRCSRACSSTEYLCDNCGNAGILITDLSSFGAKVYYFGCPRCKLQSGSPHCPACGTDLGGVAKIGRFR
jgi:hypothetical protein